MTQLALLRSRLSQLHGQRKLLRWTTAWSAVALAVLWALGAAFLLDWSLAMSRAQRVVLLVMVGVAILWAFRRYALPWLGARESEIDLALMVERQQSIDSDLVAALQFESPASGRRGSPELERAVIDYVAEFSRDLNVFEGLPRAPARRRVRLLALTLAPLVVLAALFPHHFSAFVNRMFLGSAHYPTRTVLERIVINGTSIPPAKTAASVVACPYGQPLELRVACGGELPPQGTAVLRGLTGGAQTELVLQPSEENGAEFVAELPRLVDSVRYELYFGDAWTDPGTIQLIPLPVVTVDLEPVPPKYAAGALLERDENQPGARRIAVIEGSRVNLHLTCENKPLSEAVLTIDGESWPLEKVVGEKGVWALPAARSPLARVTEALRYEIQVKDEDGLGLERPARGYIRIKADRPPRVAATMVSRRVLPTATPRITFGAADDYGLSRLTAQLQISRADGATETRAVEIRAVPTKDQPQTALRGDYALDLSPYQLAKGDELKVTLEAFDYRGDSPAKSAFSEPLVLEVTDREGILAALLEADEKSARQLDAIIRRELGIGESQ
jgi:hypothetical protein